MTQLVPAQSIGLIPGTTQNKCDEAGLLYQHSGDGGRRIKVVLSYMQCSRSARVIGDLSQKKKETTDRNSKN